MARLLICFSMVGYCLARRLDSSCAASPSYKKNTALSLQLQIENSNIFNVCFKCTERCHKEHDRATSVSVQDSRSAVRTANMKPAKMQLRAL